MAMYKLKLILKMQKDYGCEKCMLELKEHIRYKHETFLVDTYVFS